MKIMNVIINILLMLRNIINKIALMLTHPHFFNEMDNFCTGSQFEENKVLRELQQYPNPITYIAEMIRVTNDINFNDSYYVDRYMCDVFENWSKFNEFSKCCYRLKEMSKFLVNRNDDNKEKSVLPSSFHTLSNNCFCVDCITFKFWVFKGLKFDPTKLIFSEISEISREKFDEGIEFFYGRSDLTVGDKIELKNFADIDLTNEKYHISNKSPFDQVNAGFRISNFYLGLFNDKNGSVILLNTSELKEMYLEYNQLHTLITNLSKLRERNIPNDEYERIQILIPIIQEKLIDIKKYSLKEYFNKMFTQILVTSQV